MKNKADTEGDRNDVATYLARKKKRLFKRGNFIQMNKSLQNLKSQKFLRPETAHMRQ